MNVFRFGMFLFILTALTIGVTLNNNGGDISLIDRSINNASMVIENISITTIDTSGGLIELNGFYLVIEKYIQFIGTLGIEVMRAGMKFGYSNPGYFDPIFIFQILRLVLIFFIISLLIKPVMYLCIFIFMLGLWIKDKLKKGGKNGRKKFKS